MAAELGDLAAEAFGFEVLGVNGGPARLVWMDSQQSNPLISERIFAFPGNSPRNENRGKPGAATPRAAGVGDRRWFRFRLAVLRDDPGREVRRRSQHSSTKELGVFDDSVATVEEIISENA